MDALFDLVRDLLPPGAPGAIGVFVSAALTFMVFTYVAGDNLFFRLAQHILIGVVAAYAVVVAVHGVLIGQLLAPLAMGMLLDWSMLVPLLMGVLLLAKARPGSAWLGNLPVGFMLGVGAALGISGAVLGTLVPQLWAAAQSLLAGATAEMTPLQRGAQALGNIVALLGTLGALLSFQFVRGGDGAPARALGTLVSLWGGLGRAFIWIALGALLAGLALSRVTLLVGRVQFLMDTFRLAVR